MSNFKKMILITALSSMFICGYVFAYMFKEASIDEKTFEIGSVSCEVIKKNNTSNNTITSINVKNTGTLDSFIRVKVISYWVKDINGEYRITSKQSSAPELNLKGGWVHDGNGTYYHKYSVSPNSDTGEMLASAIKLLEVDGQKQVVEIFAEAIQSLPWTAVQETWNVRIDDNGDIKL